MPFQLTDCSRISRFHGSLSKPRRAGLTLPHSVASIAMTLLSGVEGFGGGCAPPEAISDGRAAIR